MSATQTNMSKTGTSKADESQASKSQAGIVQTDVSNCCSPRRKDLEAPALSQDTDASIEADHISALSTLSHMAKIPQQAVAVPGGKALIGTDAPQIPVDEEGPLRQTSLRPFWMDAHVVSNARFAEFVSETGYETEAERLGDSFVFYDFLPDGGAQFQSVAAAPWWRMVAGANWQKPCGPDSDVTPLADHPVVHVSWNDAQAFAKWAGGRLPSEAEWEHAARGGLGDAIFPWGDRAPNEVDFFPCNIWQGIFPNQNDTTDGYAGAAPVDAFQPNGYGLYNMCGNVWEWTSQPFKVRSLKKEVKMAHQGKVGFKIVKGGSFLCHISYCYRYRIAARTGNSPDSSTSHTGFRLVYDTNPQQTREAG